MSEAAGSTDRKQGLGELPFLFYFFFVLSFFLGSIFFLSNRFQDLSGT